MEAVLTLDRDCSALAGLFQLIVNDMKGSGPMWEEFLSRTSKLHNALKSTIGALSSFLDAFQRIADAATSTRGATKEIGAALTRICLRHRAVESRMKSLNTVLVECVVLPLQERLEEWRRTVHTLDKDHTKEYKKSRGEIKKRMESAARLQKKAKKMAKGSELNKVGKMMETTVGELAERYTSLEETERTALRHALTEERARYCAFAHAFRPVLDEEVGMLSELEHLQEVMAQLDKYSSEPNILPPASEQVLRDIKGGESQWSWQTPPSSPSSLGSRKSSMCSISSLNSSSSSSNHSPSHHNHRTRSVSQGTRLVSVSSQDSGFTSQDTLCQHHPHVTSQRQASGLSEQSCGSEGSTPSPATSNATWPNLTDTTLHSKSAHPQLSDRPHTISSAYEKGRERPPLTVYTFQPPEGNSGPASPQVSSQPVSPVCLESEGGNVSPLISQTATISRRSSRASLHHNVSSSSQESLTTTGKPKPPVPNRCSSLERPVVPEKKPILKGISRTTVPQYITSKAAPIVPDFNQAAPDMIVPQPVYSNMAELCSGVVGNGTKSDVITSSSSSGGEIGESDGSQTCIGSSGYGSQPNLQEESSTPEDMETSGHCTQRRYSEDQYHQVGPVVVLRRPFSKQAAGSPHIGGTVRRSSSQLHKPPPPVRRTPSMTSTCSATLVPASTATALNPSISSTNLSSSSNSLQAAGVNQIPSVMKSSATTDFVSAVKSSSTTDVTSSPMKSSATTDFAPSRIRNSSTSEVTSSSMKSSTTSDLTSHTPSHSHSSSSNGSSSNGSPLQRTDSESSTPVGSLENLPPPPAFLLEDEDKPDPETDLTTPEGVRFFSDPFGPPSPIADECLQRRAMSVSDAVKTLQENRHQPSSPLLHRRSQSFRSSQGNSSASRALAQSEERRVSIGETRASIIHTLNAKFAHQQHPLHHHKQQHKHHQKQVQLTSQESGQSPHANRRIRVQPANTIESQYHTISIQHKKEGVYDAPVFQPGQHQSTFASQPISQSHDAHQSGSCITNPSNNQATPQQTYSLGFNKSKNQQAFLHSLNAKLSQRQSLEGNSTSGSPKPRRKSTSHVSPSSCNNKATALNRTGSAGSDKASKVRQWIASKTSSDSPGLRESLLDQIRRGTSLRRAKQVADRSAPQVH
ncbi:uncharacterized protein LOC143032354 isoform X3 [Oratosquilla oratoria]|uniref:uncharacterized protein LOC143032354 isoform X3 n=1 Tax=Oratosquilla oratoria TaxID=337810 RepID=UPI003F760081